MGDYKPDWWFHQCEVITPDDIRQMCDERVEAGEDKELVEAALRLAVKEAGGTIEQLAQKWTRDLDYARLRYEYDQQLARARRKPTQSQEKEYLRRLIDQYPEAALRTIAEIQRSQSRRSQAEQESDGT